MWCVLVFAGGTVAAPEPVTIAVIASKTGDAAPSNQVLFQTARFAVDELNAAGGLLGRRIEILELDNHSTPLGSKAAAEAAVEAGVVAVIGASWSSHSNAMAAVLQPAGMPMVTPISTNPKVTLHGDYIFRVCYTDPFQGRVMARYAREELGIDTAVTLVNVSRTYSVDLSDYFEKSFTELGGRIVWRGEFLIDAADYRRLLETVRKHDPDAIYIPGDYRDSSFIIKQAHDLNIDAVILGGDAFGMRLYDYIGDLAEGCYYTTNWHRDSDWPPSREFVRRFEAVHGPIKQTTIPLTYDAVTIWADAVRRAKTFDRSAVRDALARTRDWVGVTGTISFDANGDPIKPAVINQLADGGIRFIKSVHP
jgi:branched-chain amino acid transport system substrate-binding protein